MPLSNRSGRTHQTPPGARSTRPMSDAVAWQLGWTAARPLGDPFAFLGSATTAAGRRCFAYLPARSLRLTDSAALAGLKTERPRRRQTVQRHLERHATAPACTVRRRAGKRETLTRWTLLLAELDLYLFWRRQAPAPGRATDPSRGVGASRSWAPDTVRVSVISSSAAGTGAVTYNATTLSSGV